MRNARRWMLAGLVIGCAVFLCLVLDQAFGGPGAELDQRLNAAVAGPSAHEVGEVLSTPGDRVTILVVTIVTVAWLLGHRQFALAGWCVGIVVATTAVVQGLKALAQRERPPVFGELMQDYSFPSGHTFAATASLGAVVLLGLEGLMRTHRQPRQRELRFWVLAIAVWLALAAITGVGRVLSQEHWMTDVAASWALGLSLVSGILFVLSARARGGDPGPTPPEPRPEDDPPTPAPVPPQA